MVPSLTVLVLTYIKQEIAQYIAGLAFADPQVAISWIEAGLFCADAGEGRTMRDAELQRFLR